MYGHKSKLSVAGVKEYIDVLVACLIFEIKSGMNLAKIVG